MIEIDENESRDMLPRWLPLRQAATTGEFSPLSKEVSNPATLERSAALKMRGELAFTLALEAWTSNREEIEAQELVAAAVVLNIRSDEVFNAATLLLSNPEIIPSMRSVVNVVIGTPQSEAERQIASLSAETRLAIAKHKKTAVAQPT